MWRRPIAQVSGGGVDLVSVYGKRLIELKVKLNKRSSSDTCTLVVADPGRGLRRPKKNEEFEVRVGWVDEGFGYMGKFKVQKVTHSGEPEDVDRLTITMRAADLGERLKASRRRAFQEGSTVGEALRWVAGEAGISPRIHPEVARQPLEYELMWDQSLIDFATELGDRYGFDVRPGDGNLIANPRGSYQSAGGSSLGTITIRRDRYTRHDVEFEERPAYGSVAASYHDRRNGRRRVARASTGRTGPIATLPHTFGSEAEARRAAETQGFELGNATSKAEFEGPGRPRARPGAKGVAEGFGPDIDGPIGECKTIEHVLTAKGFFSKLEFGSAREQRGNGAGGRTRRNRTSNPGLTGRNNDASNRTGGGGAGVA